MAGKRFIRKGGFAVHVVPVYFSTVHLLTCLTWAASAENLMAGSYLAGLPRAVTLVSHL